MSIPCATGAFQRWEGGFDARKFKILPYPRARRPYPGLSGSIRAFLKPLFAEREGFETCTLPVDRAGFFVLKEV